jgi:hypothetical protein
VFEGHRGVSEPLLAHRPEPLELRRTLFSRFSTARQASYTLDRVRSYLGAGHRVLLTPASSVLRHAPATEPSPSGSRP